MPRTGGVLNTHHKQVRIPHGEDEQSRPRREVVGLIPAAGYARRISPLPCSKELYPVGFRPVPGGRGVRPKAACQYLLEQMQLAGVTKAFIVLRAGKWDLPAYLGGGEQVDMRLAYLIANMMNLPFGPPYTLDQAFPFVQDALVAFGFPDILSRPEDAFCRLLERQAATNADVVLGLFPAEEPDKVDMVTLDHAGRVRQLETKPRRTDARDTWAIAVWTPAFTRFMHDYLGARQTADTAQDSAAGSALGGELTVGEVIRAALHGQMRVEGVPFPGGACLDIGEPDALVRAVREQW